MKQGVTGPYDQRLYGRKKDRPLTARQRDLIDDLLPRLAVPDPSARNVDVGALFPDADDVRLEIGFGGGEHLTAQAELRKTVGFIGVDPFVNGVAKLLTQIEDRGLENICVHHGDARPLLDALPDASLSTIYLLYPDPWPKKRHWKRRLVSAWFLDQVERLLKPGGEFRFASDISSYVRWTLIHVQGRDALFWAAEKPDDWRLRPADQPMTRYEAKAKGAGRTPAYLSFIRR